MGPISPVAVVPTRSPGSAGAGLNAGNAAEPTSGGPRLASPRLAGDGIALTQVHAAVSQLLQSIGGGAENDKVLRMLIALMIVLALLEGSRDGAGSPGKALAPLSGGMGRPQFAGAYYSSTTITVEQTTTTVTFSASDSYSPDSQIDQAGPGGQIDVAA